MHGNIEKMKDILNNFMNGLNNLSGIFDNWYNKGYLLFFLFGFIILILILIFSR